MSHGTDDPTGHHVVPVGVYIAVFVALLVLTGLTVWVAMLDLGAWNTLHTPLALGIATLKGLLVVLYFMHVRHAVRLTWVFIAAGLLWLAILIGITLADYVGRDWLGVPGGWTTAVLEAAPDIAARGNELLGLA